MLLTAVMKTLIVNALLLMFTTECYIDSNEPDVLLCISNLCENDFLTEAYTLSVLGLLGLYPLLIDDNHAL